MFAEESPSTANILLKCIHSYTRFRAWTAARRMQLLENLDSGDDGSRLEAVKKPPKWKQQSAQLRAAMLATRPNELAKAAAAFPGAVVLHDVILPYS